MKIAYDKFGQKKFILNKSRRKFLLFGTTAFLSLSPLFLDNSKKDINEEEFILVNGWILKKEDFYDL